MSYTPHTPEEIRAMLARIGAGSIEELFETIPASLREAAALKLPPAQAERSVAQVGHILKDRKRQRKQFPAPAPRPRRGLHYGYDGSMISSATGALGDARIARKYPRMGH